MAAGKRDEDYQRRLGDVLRASDVAALRAFLAESAARFGDQRQLAQVQDKSDAELERLLHQMILARNDLADLHAGSWRWFDEHDQRGGERRN